MSVDFNKLIVTPQGNTIPQKPAVPVQSAVSAPVVATPAVTTPVASAPVIQQPLQKDTFTTQVQKTSEPVSFLDKALKYSGVIALVATPVAVFATHKFGNKNVNDKAIKELSNAIADIGKKLEDNVSGIKTAQTELKTQVADIAKNVIAVTGTLTTATLILNSIGNVKGSAKNQFQKSQEISQATKDILETEATKRINGEHKWQELKNIQGWMVTSETQTFLKIGGLGEVAVQLPDAFNKKFVDEAKKEIETNKLEGKEAEEALKNAKENNHLDIITPLYVGNDGDKKSASVEQIDDTHFLYKGSEGKEITLTKMGDLKIKVYDPKSVSYKNEDVDVLSGTFDGTKYVFFRNDKMFSIDPHKNNKPECKGAYVLNDKNVGEAERMLFFSKATYQLMKSIKEGKFEGEQAPNLIVANDWHAAGMAPLMRYKAPVDIDKKRMSQETYDYIKNTPIIHVTHNAKLEGKESDPTVADKLVRNIFEEDTDDISPLLKAYNEEGWPLSDGKDTYNSAKADIYLADRVVPVSNNYAEELTKSIDLTNNPETREANTARKKHQTMIGIVNGYDKVRLLPNQGLMKKINDTFQAPIAYKPFDTLTGDEAYSVKLENKKATFAVLNEFANRAVKGEHLLTLADPTKDVSLYKPQDSKLPENLDITKVPFIATVGRLDNQKGFDYMTDSLTNIIANLKPGQECPVIAVLGSGEKDVETKLKEFKDKMLVKYPEAAKRIFIFTGFNIQMRDAFGIGSDFFAIPSKWEPCGLTQMECMSKGSIPVATSTGGLPDTITDSEDGFLTDEFFGYATNEHIYPSEADVKSGNVRNHNQSFLKVRDNIDSYTVALNRAFNTFYNEPDKIKQMSINAMAKDFSWNLPNGPLDQYIELMQTGKVTKK